MYLCIYAGQQARGAGQRQFQRAQPPQDRPTSTRAAVTCQLQVGAIKETSYAKLFYHKNTVAEPHSRIRSFENLPACENKRTSKRSQQSIS
jgi:hypothetical protein